MGRTRSIFRCLFRDHSCIGPFVIGEDLVPELDGAFIVEEAPEGEIKLVEHSQALVTHDSPRFNPFTRPDIERATVSVPP